MLMTGTQQAHRVTAECEVLKSRWHDRTMILTLDITKIESGLYEARLSSGGAEVASYGTLTEALRH